MHVLKDRKGLIYYFTITYVISWLLWLPAILESQNLLIYQFSEFLVKLGGFVPSIVGLFITFLHDRTIGVKGLFRKALRFKFPALWYLYIFLFMPSITFVSYLFTNWTGGIGFSSILLPLLRPQFWLIVPILLYFIILQGPLGEEFGWRGYALEKLLLRWNPLVSSLILGFFWSVWHLPLFFVPGTIQSTLAEQGIAITFIGYLFYTVMLTILITVLYCKTGRSLLSALLFHAIANFSHGLFTVIITPRGGLSVLFFMFVSTVVTAIINRKDLLCSVMKAANVR